MKILKKESLLKLGFESILIVFSVMFALMLDEYRVSWNLTVSTDKALSNVQQEIAANLKVIEKWHEYHVQVSENVEKILSAEEIPENEFLRNGGVHYFKVIPKGVVQELIDDSAWLAFKSSESFSNLDFETQITLSRVYKLQSVGVQKSLQLILNDLSSREFLDLNLLKQNLIILRRHFGEIASQEAYLIEHYKNTLEYLQSNRGD